MSGFTTHRGKAAVFLNHDVDTDRIIPARFLSMITRSGYGELLFADVRGPEFPLDQPEARDASVLVVGNNFGCGSSREHAVWAIQQAGFKAVVAEKRPENPGYSDIFRSNAGNCGLALIELDTAAHAQLAAQGNGLELEIDLPNQVIRSGGQSYPFEINPATKKQLIDGLDLIGMTLSYQDDIARFEEQHTAFVPPQG